MGKVPKLRFEGFTGEWEHSKLGQHCDMYNGDRSSKYPNDSDLVPKGIPFINAGDLVDGRVNLVSAKKITREKYNDLGGAKIKKGDIVYCLRGTLGKNAYIDDFDEGTVASSLVCIRPKDIIGRFLYYVLNSNIEYTQRIICDEGAAQPNLSAKSVSNYSIPFPCVREQEQIGILLDSLYTLLTLHQRKHSALLKAKKFYLQNLFPRKGEKTPRLRFAGFTGEWEEKRFKDFTWDAGKRNRENLDLEPFAITSEHGFIPQNEAHDEFGYMKDTDRKAYNIVSPNSFGYNPARINIGSIGYYSGTEKVIVSSLYEVFQTDDSVDDKFLWHWFKSGEFPRWVEKLQEGSVRLYFYYDKLCECHMNIPKVEEQRAIAFFLDSLDHLITTQQRKLETLKRLKQFLLQNLFV